MGEKHLTLLLFVRIWNAYLDYERGIMPGRLRGGRGAVNPWLLRAFVVIGNAKARAEAEIDAERRRQAKG